MPLYQLYNLALESEIEFPELLPLEPAFVNDKVVVTFRVGGVPTALNEVTNHSILYQLNSHQCLYALPSIGRFLISDGWEVVVQPEAGANEATIRLIFLDTILVSIFHQRRMFPIHGSSIQTAEGAVIFAGNTCTGKSTFAAVFEQKGYSVLADDITVIEFADDGTPYVLPSYPSLKLWPDVLEMLGYTSYDAFQPVRPGIAKYYFPLGESFYRHPAKLKAFYTIELGAAKQTSLLTMGVIEKIPTLNSLIHSLNMAFQMGILHDYWHLTNNLVRDVHMKKLSRARNDYNFGDMIQYFLEDDVK